ncbi:MAG: hypothetical protein HYZ42_17905, partial [Bacteroidetes bacterium]|nr:hypothetical protein [Bacteroidota bacterium]
MSNSSKETKNIFESVMEAQKQVLDNMKNSTEQFTKNMGKLNPMEANGEMFNKWYEEQMAFMNKTINSTNPTTTQYQEMFNNWMNVQMTSFKEFVEKAQKGGMENFSNMNPMNTMNNNWMNNDMTKGFTEMANNMKNTMTPWMNMLKNNDSKNAFEGMMNNMSSFNRFSEMWAPIMNQLNNNSFKPEMLNKLFDLDQYKNMINQMFGMAPEGVKNMVDQFTNNMKGFYTQNNESAQNAWNQMQSNMNNLMPNMGNGMFQTSLDNYNQIVNEIQKASSPLMKMMTPGNDRDQLETYSRINNLMVTFTTKNNQMNHLMYITGLKSFEKLAEATKSKMEKGEQPSNMLASYQEWLNINDKVYTELFDSEAYSAMQSELASNGMRLKKEIDLQLEKSMSSLPLINRSEMDELYQTIYDLKKKVKGLEKQVENSSVVAEKVEETKATTTAKPTAKK